MRKFTVFITACLLAMTSLFLMPATAANIQAGFAVDLYQPFAQASAPMVEEAALITAQTEITIDSKNCTACHVGKTAMPFMGVQVANYADQDHRSCWQYNTIGFPTIGPAALTQSRRQVLDS